MAKSPMQFLESVLYTDSASALAIKGTTGIVGAGIVATGGYFVFTGLRSMPHYVIVQSNDKNTYTGKFGASYKHHLIDASADFNKGWWEWSYGNWTKEGGLSDEFKSGTAAADSKITSAFSSSDSKALNKVCESVYQQEDSKVSFEDGNDAKHKLGKDILKYCSPLGTPPLMLEKYKSEIYPTGSIGEANRSSLVSIKAGVNYHFWTSFNQYFMALNPQPTDKFFGQFFKEGDNGQKFLTKHLGYICRRAYGSAPADAEATEDKPKPDDVKKYCSFSKLSSPAPAS